jgi:c(7)-type cytochrome triheme protein
MNTRSNSMKNSIMRFIERFIQKGGIQKVAPVCLGLLVVVGAFSTSTPVQAEYGDIVLNNYSDEAQIRPVIFPHWFHRIRYRCKTCHGDLGFKIKAGGSDINMLKIINGEYCGACHNGKIAWAMENCDLCHSAKPGTPTQAHKSSKQSILSPKTIEKK